MFKKTEVYSFDAFLNHHRKPTQNDMIGGSFVSLAYLSMVYGFFYSGTTNAAYYVGVPLIKSIAAICIYKAIKGLTHGLETT